MREKVENLLGVRETANRLGVHENTVRRLAKAGTLTAIRTPGSRYQRFEESEVERVRASRDSREPALKEERRQRQIGPELVDGTTLASWADRREAQSVLPRLVRRLLSASPGVVGIDMRAGEGVAIGGWDGKATATQALQFLPKGQMWFEMGVSRNPKQKAEEDYRKRTEEPGPANPATSYFVFVTPRRWRGGGLWAAEKEAEGKWLGVRVIDADQLEGWLEVTPNVHAWISEEVGLEPQGVQTLEQWWSEFRTRTDPEIPAELLLAGRSSERDGVVEFSKNPGLSPGVASEPTNESRAIGIKASSRSEATAFVYAALSSEDDHPVRERALVVSGPSAWRRLCQEAQPLLLIPAYDGADVAFAVQSGHYVISPFGQSEVLSAGGIELRRIDRAAAREAIEKAHERSGFEEADELAALARRGFSSFLRSRSRDPGFLRPDWAQNDALTITVPLLLAGQWTEAEGDLSIVVDLAGQDWPSIERALVGWMNSEDPPFVRSGSGWRLVSPEDALTVLQGSITRSQLKTWQELAINVLSEQDPRDELSPEERQFAPINNVGRDFSGTLREGLAQTLALLGSAGDVTGTEQSEMRQAAEAVVHRLLEEANADASGKAWRSLADVLPLLAEAGPQVFLDFITDDLERTNPVLRTIFEDKEDFSGLGSSSAHTGLLWALETVAWPEDHFAFSVEALTRLAEVDPGGRLANRPLSSLSSIFKLWHPYTRASSEARQAKLEKLVGDYPKAGWELLLALWPEGHETAWPTHTPRFRDWRREKPGVTRVEWYEGIVGVVSLAIEAAGDEPERWKTLIERLSTVPPPQREELIDALQGLATPDQLDERGQLDVWEALRDLVGRHRSFADADWALDEDTLGRLDDLAASIEPTDSVERYAWVFDWHPDLDGVDRGDFEVYNQELERRQQEAAAEILESTGLDGIARVAERCEVPRKLGFALGQVVSRSSDEQLVRWLDATDRRAEVAEAWATHTTRAEGLAWVRGSMARIDDSHAERRVLLALCTPATAELWAYLDEDPFLAGQYWSRAVAIHLSDEENLEEAARRFLASGRPWQVIDLLAMHFHRQKEERIDVPTDLIVQTLDAALESDADDRSVASSLAYEVGVLLDQLDRHGVDTEIQVRFEWAFFRLLDHHRTPKALYAYLGDNPAAFVDLVSRVYRGKSERKRKQSPEDAQHAQHAWHVLDDWRQVPGAQADGSIDSERLNQWVREARNSLAELDRADIGDQLIGQVLAGSAVGDDGIWPAPEVRDVIETIGSREIESGLRIGRRNLRGVTSRGVYDGGDQERELVAQFAKWAKETSSQWPRTSRTLTELAESYEWEARRNDDDAAARQDER